MSNFCKISAAKRLLFAIRIGYKRGWERCLCTCRGCEYHRFTTNCTLQLYAVMMTSVIVVGFFYRATLRVSAVFAVSQCPSVSPSVTLVYCIQTAEDIVKLLSRPGSPIILVFRLPAPVSNSKGNPFSGGAKTWVWDNFAIFDYRIQ